MRSLIKGLGLLACLVGAATVACGASGDETEADDANLTQGEIDGAFDVNDVSVLFPIKGNAPYPQVRASGAGLGATPDAVPPEDQQPWGKTVFEAVIAEAKRQNIQSGFEGVTSPLSDFFKLRGLWHIVGMRFDPCAPGFEDAILDALPGAQKGKCIIQFRLIAQPYREGSKDGEDFTTHLVFNLGSVAKSDLPKHPVIQGASKLFGQLKDASAKLPGGKTAGQPLGVHPGLEAEAKKGGSELAGIVKTIIKTFTATPSRAIAFMGLQNGGPEPWTFFAGRVEGTKFTLEPGPVHRKNGQSLDFITGNGPVNPKSSARVSTTPLFDADSADSLTPEQRKLAFQVENPKTGHFFNLDCVSCHTSSARTHDLPLGDKAEISARVKVPKNITGYVTKAQAQESSWNVRNFGYFFEKPTVSGRTVTETVEVVEWFNKNVRAPGAGINGPGPDCTAVDDAVWKCFRDGKQDCLKQCKPAPVPTPAVPEREPVPMSLDRAGDPCTTPTVGGAPTVTVTQAGTVLLAALGGNDSQCLSRILGGAFLTQGVLLGCTTPNACLVTVEAGGKDAATIEVTGDEFQRLRQFLRLQPNSFFQSRSTAAGVQLSCGNSSCKITVASAAASLPGGAGTRINQ
jgi:hypothetical protein